MMKNSSLKDGKILFQTTNWLLIIGLVILFLIYFRALLQPFIMALIFWFLIKGMRDYAGKIRIASRPIPRWLRDMIAFFLILVVIWGIVQVLIINVELIIEKSPEYAARFQKYLDTIKESYLFSQFSQSLKGNVFTPQLQSYLSQLLGSISNMVGNTIFIIVYVIFLLIEESMFSKKIRLLFPEPTRLRTTLTLLDKINQSVNSYLFIKTGVSVLTGVLGYIVLVLLKVDFPFLWAFLLFLLNYIPYLGSFVATILPSIFAIFQYASFWPFLWVFLALEFIQLLVGSYIEPRIAGKTLNLSPLVIIISLAFWGAIWGVLGMMLAIPITSIIAIFLVYFPSTHQLAIAVSGYGEIGSKKIRRKNKPLVDESISGKKMRSAILNISPELPHKICAKLPFIYIQQEGWLGYVEYDSEGTSMPHWFGYEEDKKFVKAHLDNKGLKIEGRMEVSEWQDWMDSFKKSATEVLGFKVTDLESGEINPSIEYISDN